ncbi:Zn-finger protein [Ordospora colligata]|nr:Zn-finger protein [Ordospora colligata]
MEYTGYEEEIKEAIQVNKIPCFACGEQGEIRTVRITAVEPHEVVCVFACDACGQKTVDVLGDGCNAVGSVCIECEFDDKSDLSREMNLTAMTSVEIISEEFSYTYESNTPSTCIVESILVKAEDQLKNACGEGDYSTGSGSSMFVDVQASHEECKKKLEYVRQLISSETPKFKMIIRDSTGVSRIASVGKKAVQDVSSALDTNDSKLNYTFKSYSEEE